MKKNKLSAEAALRFHIRPLYDRHRKLALLISAKSACTTAVKWFFHHTGHLQAAEQFDRWIHQYRLRVYYKSDDYQQHLSELLRKKYTIVKVVRNPYDRAVSSFIHGMKHNLESHQMRRALSSKRLVRSTFFAKKHPPGRYTFREFIHYLEQFGVDEGNVHFRTQWHPLERYVAVNHLIRMTNLASGFREVENRLGLAPTDMNRFSNSVHHTHRSTQHDLHAMDKRFDLYRRNDTVVPAFSDFYDAELAAKVAKLYEIDFRTYGYDLSSKGWLGTDARRDSTRLDDHRRAA